VDSDLSSLLISDYSSSLTVDYTIYSCGKENAEIMEIREVAERELKLPKIYLINVYQLLLALSILYTTFL